MRGKHWDKPNIRTWDSVIHLSMSDMVLLVYKVTKDGEIVNDFFQCVKIRDVLNP